MRGTAVCSCARSQVVGSLLLDPSITSSFASFCGRARARNEFSVARMTDRTVALYERVLARK